jgi:hypothetical protein
VTIDAAQSKRLRGVIIEVLYGRHTAQLSRADHVMLWHSMRDLGCDVGENDVLTTLQDLCDRDCVRFNQRKSRLTNRTEISLIQLTPRGRDLAEGTIQDPAIQF